MPDLLILEEASCIRTDSVWPMLAKTPTNLLIVGDTCQLRPFHGDRVEEPSILELLSRSGVAGFHLNKVYRCAPEIFRWSRRLFYPMAEASKKPRVEISVGGQRVSLPPILLVQCPETFIPERVGTSFRNSQEASVVCNYAAKLKVDCTIISPYTAQLETLRNRGRGVAPVHSADSFQGAEADAVLVSLVRRGPSAGFLDNSNRLNMIMTRAKLHIALFGDFYGLRAMPMWENFVNLYSNRLTTVADLRMVKLLD